jgi:hypothetical protein
MADVTAVKHFGLVRHSGRSHKSASLGLSATRPTGLESAALPTPPGWVADPGGRARVQVVAVVGIPLASALGHVATQVDIPDLPACPEAGFERSDGLLRGGHLSPRSASAASIAWRRSAGLTARTTSGGLLRGRRA